MMVAKPVFKGVREGAFHLCIAVLTLGCGAAARTEVADNTADAPVLAVQDDSADTQNDRQVEIVDSKEVEISFAEQLRVHYEEMGLPAELVSLLVAARVEFVIPEQFDGVLPEANALWQYDYALKAKSGKVHVLFKILPGENTASADNGGNVSTANELMNVIIRLNGANLVADMQEHPGTEASSRFNASSYITGTFQPVPEFSAMSLASAGLIYREGRGRIVVVTLMDSMEDGITRTEWITGANAIRFAEDPSDDSNKDSSDTNTDYK